MTDPDADHILRALLFLAWGTLLVWGLGGES